MNGCDLPSFAIIKLPGQLNELKSNPLPVDINLPFK